MSIAHSEAVSNGSEHALGQRRGAYVGRQHARHLLDVHLHVVGVHGAAAVAHLLAHLLHEALALASRAHDQRSYPLVLLCTDHAQCPTQLSLNCDLQRVTFSRLPCRLPCSSYFGQLVTAKKSCMGKESPVHSIFFPGVCHQPERSSCLGACAMSRHP